MRLKPLLNSIFEEAYDKGQASRTLARGLRIAMKVCGGRVSVGAARQGAFPSRREWELVIAHLPDWFPALPEPRQTIWRSWHWLFASADLPPLRTTTIDLNAAGWRA